MKIVNIVSLILASLIMNGFPVHAEQQRHFGVLDEAFEIDSKYVNQTYEINVSVPPSCREANMKCPTVYFADANFFFGNFKTMPGWLHSLGVPAVIVVGIGYPDDAETANIQVLRRRDLEFQSEEYINFLVEYFDFIPNDTRKQVPTFGKGAPEFLKFIRNELIQEIEKRYRADPNERTYYGWASGSHFGLYTLFTKPDTFNRYVLGDGFEKPYLDLAEKYARSGKPLDAHLFFGVGLDEPLEPSPFNEVKVSDYHKLARILNAASIQGLEYSYQAWPGEVHHTVWAPIFMHGMQSVFNPPGCKPFLYPNRKCPVKK